MAGLPREIIKWLQSLDLTWQVKVPKWDFASGYLIAEIFSWYFPQECGMHLFINGQSLDVKQKNWDVLKVFFKRNSIEIPEEYIDATMHCKDTGAQLLIETIYRNLTNREVRKLQPTPAIDYTDRRYQEMLPLHARSTAAKSIKNNLKSTEVRADPNIVLNQQKVHLLIDQHNQLRRIERKQDMERFGVKPTLAELAYRRAPPTGSDASFDLTYQNPVISQTPKSKTSSAKSEHDSRKANSPVPFHEIQVKQLNHKGNQQSVAGY